MAIDVRAGIRAPNPSWLWAAAAICASVACLELIEPIASIPFRVANNFNEGWNAYWAIAAASGSQLYPATGALISNNYPPLSFFVIGFLARPPADPILTGRIVALVGMLLVTLNVILWLRVNGVRISLALLCGAAFIITTGALAPSYVAQNDPQWLGHALMTTGLVVLWRNPRSAARVTSAATLIILGGSVKHLLLALPAALSVWLYNKNRRAFWQWLAFIGALGLLFFAVAFAWYGQSLVDGILGAPRRLTIKRPFLVAYTILPPLIPFLCFSALLFRKYRASGAARFALNYLAIGSAVAALASAGDGVWVNVAFDIAIASALATGMALEDINARFSRDYSRSTFLLGVCIVAGLLFALSAAMALRVNFERLHALSAKIQANTADIEFLRAHDVRGAACEALALCFWAGAPFNLDSFNFGQKLKTGRVPIEACSHLFDGTHYSILQLSSSPTSADAQLPGECSRDIAEHYQLVRSSINGVFLIPQSQPQRPASGSRDLPN